MGVLAIWRYPVKAMLGERLAEAAVGAGGVESDRRWVVRDAGSGEAIANKRGPTDPRLRACRAAVDANGELVVVFPDGSRRLGADAAAAALSQLLGRRVLLSEHARSPTGGYLRTSGHHDFGPLHVLTRQSLAHMRRLAPDGDWDARRFRPNVLLDDPLDGLSEARLVGRTLGGRRGVRVRVGLPTPRCVVPTRAQEELPRAPRLLRALADESRWDLGPFGRPVCLGVYAEVTAPGRLRVGDVLPIGPRVAQSPQAAIDATVAHIARALA